MKLLMKIRPGQILHQPEQFEMPADTAEKHLIFEFHNYDPQSFCWPQNPDGSNKNETPYWNDERDSQILSEVFENLLSFKGKLNAPIICGEYAAWPKKIDMDTNKKSDVSTVLIA